MASTVSVDPATTATRQSGRRPGHRPERLGPSEEQRRPCRRQQLRRHRDRVVRLLHLRHGRRPRARPAVLPRRLRPSPAPSPRSPPSRSASSPGRSAASSWATSATRSAASRCSSRRCSLMGIATVGIGLLPNYATIGVWAPILLVLLRFLQGVGVGGEWGGAVLMATEHAPKGKARPLRRRPADGRACRRGPRQRRLPPVHPAHDRAAVHLVGLARAVPAQRHARRRRHVDPSRRHGEPGVQGRRAGGPDHQDPDPRGAHQELEDGSPRRRNLHRHQRHRLRLHGLRALLRHQGARLQPRHHARPAHRLLPGVDGRDGPVRPPLRPRRPPPRLRHLHDRPARRLRGVLHPPRHRLHPGHARRDAAAGVRARQHRRARSPRSSPSSSRRTSATPVPRSATRSARSSAAASPRSSPRGSTPASAAPPPSPPTSSRSAW